MNCGDAAVSLLVAYELRFNDHLTKLHSTNSFKLHFNLCVPIDRNKQIVVCITLVYIYRSDFNASQHGILTSDVS